MVRLKQNDRRKSATLQDGFTLLEVLVAVVILSLGLLGTAGLTTGVIRGNRYSKNVTSATAAAQTNLEAIKSGGYAYATSTNFPNDSVAMGGMTFARTTIITNASPAANMKTISVTVTWNDANNTSRSVNLETIIAE